MGIAKRVVSIGAHSLDAELLGGPLILKYAKEGSHATLIHVTQGRLEDPNATKEEKEVYLQSLLLQNQEAAITLGGDTMWLGYVSSNMPSQDEFAKRLESYFEKEQVELVITHWRGSMHPRHINTHDAVTQAVKNLRKKGSFIRLIYGETFEDLQGFVPQIYFGMTNEEVSQWFDALKKYQVFNGEINDFPYSSYYTTNLKVREIESGNHCKTVAYMYAPQIENSLW